MARLMIDAMMTIYTAVIWQMYTTSPLGTCESQHIQLVRILALVWRCVSMSTSTLEMTVVVCVFILICFIRRHKCQGKMPRQNANAKCKNASWSVYDTLWAVTLKWFIHCAIVNNWVIYRMCYCVWFYKHVTHCKYYKNKQYYTYTEQIYVFTARALHS